MSEEIKKYPRLTGRKLKAFQMKFDGVLYKEIANAIHCSVYNVDRLFCKNGPWYEHYRHWEEERCKDIEYEARVRIKKRINEAMTVQEILLTMLKSNPREAAKAARDILDRAGLKAPEKIEVTDPEDKAEKITQWFEKKKDQEKKENE